MKPDTNQYCQKRQDGMKIVVAPCLVGTKSTRINPKKDFFSVSCHETEREKIRSGIGKNSDFQILTHFVATNQTTTHIDTIKANHCII